MAEAAKRPPLACVAQEVKAHATLLAVDAHNLLHVVRILAHLPALAAALGVVEADVLLRLPPQLLQDVPPASRILSAHTSVHQGCVGRLPTLMLLLARSLCPGRSWPCLAVQPAFWAS